MNGTLCCCWEKVTCLFKMHFSPIFCGFVGPQPSTWWEGGGPFYAPPPWPKPSEPETFASIAALPTAATALGSRDGQVGRSLEWCHRGEGRTSLEGWVPRGGLLSWSFLFDGRYVFYFWSFEFLMVWFCLLVSGVLDIGPLNEGGVLRLKRKVSLERSWPIEINGSDKGIVQVLRGAFCWESIFLIQKYILDGATGEHSNWFLWKPKPNKTGRKPRIWTWFSVWRVPRTEAYVQRWVAPRWLALRTWRIVCCW